MMPLRIKPVLLTLLAAVGIISGCAKKKPVLVTTQGPPPAATPEPTPRPAEPQQPAEAQTPTTNPEQNQGEKQEADKSTARPVKRRAVVKKPVSPPAASGEKPVEVARNNAPKQPIRADGADSPSSGQISPAPTPADATQNQVTTEQLLQSTEAQLNSIKRQLSKEEEAMLAQTKEFIAQSRKATTENDLVRAHNLAVKARLLSDELVKPH
jgi:hypothetical protein